MHVHIFFVLDIQIKLGSHEGHPYINSLLLKPDTIKLEPFPCLCSYKLDTYSKRHNSAFNTLQAESWWAIEVAPADFVVAFYYFACTKKQMKLIILKNMGEVAKPYYETWFFYDKATVLNKDVSFENGRDLTSDFQSKKKFFCCFFGSMSSWHWYKI